MVSATKTDYEVSELHEILKREEACSVIDVREYPEYAAGHIAGARLIPLGDLESRTAEIDRSKPVYVICRTGRRSAEAQEKLRMLGFNKVGNVTGGMTAWQQAHLPMARAQRAPWSLERQVRFVAGLLVLAGAVLSVTVAQPFVWLAGFIGAGLVFAALTDNCAMGLLLARLPWNRAPQRDTACTVERRLKRDQ